MKLAGLALTLIMLHQLDGRVIWVEATHLDIVKERGCEGKAGAVIRIGGTGFCVKETADEIRELMKNANGKR